MKQCLHALYFSFSAMAMFIVSAVSCSSAESKATGSQNETQTVTESETTNARIKFNADSAMAYLKKQVDFGPRVPGTSAHKQCADWLSETLKGFGGVVTDKIETTQHPVSGKSVAVRNIFAQFNPDATDRMLVVAHYDTRPWADNDPDPANHKTPIDGANDGASGVAVALELARLSGNLPSDKGLDILFVDQEDSGTHESDESWCIGSQLWSSKMPYTDRNRPQFGILLDMVGGRGAEFRREYFSESFARPINDLVWKAARRAGYGSRFPDEVGGAINDDHLPILARGIPTIDIIETRAEGFNPTWHTLEDNFKNIDQSTIEAVGDVMTTIIYTDK